MTVDHQYSPGELIRASRQGLHITASELADRLDISPQYLSDIERGRRTPPPRLLERTAGVLDLNAELLLWLWVVDVFGVERARRLREWVVSDGIQGMKMEWGHLSEGPIDHIPVGPA